MLVSHIRRFVAAACVAAAVSTPAVAQEPVGWGVASRDPLEFHTFSIAAVDPRTGEVGVAVTTRVPCVGNGEGQLGPRR